MESTARMKVASIKSSANWGDEKFEEMIADLLLTDTHLAPLNLTLDDVRPDPTKKKRVRHPLSVPFWSWKKRGVELSAHLEPSRKAHNCRVCHDTIPKGETKVFINLRLKWVSWPNTWGMSFHRECFLPPPNCVRCGADGVRVSERLSGGSRSMWLCESCTTTIARCGSCHRPAENMQTVDRDYKFHPYGGVQLGKYAFEFHEGMLLCEPCVRQFRVPTEESRAVAEATIAKLRGRLKL